MHLCVANLVRLSSLLICLSILRSFSKRIGRGVYISNSFQAHLNHLGQSTITSTNQQLQANKSSGRTDEVEDIDQPVVHFYETIHATNPMYDFPNHPRNVVPAQPSPRLSSESRVTTDSGIHSRAHSCDKLAQASGSDSTPSRVHKPLELSKSQEISLSPLHDESFSNSHVKHRQPSFDEIHYLSGVQMFDNAKQLRLSSCKEERNSHSRSLEMLDYPTHNYVFSEQRDSYSHSSELSQSYPSTSHLQQSKQNPEPYVEPISFHSSLHSILGQNSQLNTMV